LDTATGLGLTNEPSKLTVFKPFFIATNFPYSIKRGEIVSLSFQVYNYMDDDQEAVVTLFNSNGEFEFVQVIEDQELSCTADIEGVKTITVAAQSGVTVTFLVRPLIVGNLNIKVTATTATAGDGLEKPLKCEPEGITQYMNKAVLIDLTKSTSFNTSLTIEVPANAVGDSTRIEASAVGDILGPTLDNLDRLM
jgi:CD109 antigen